MFPAALLFVLFSCKTTVPVNTATAEEKTTSDTLILRQICDYCLGENSYYYPKKFAANTICLCYYDFDAKDTGKLQRQILEVAPSIKHITIENPSQYISSIPFTKFKSLQSLYLFGNDFNTDGLTAFPETLLQLGSLKSIEFYGVRFDKKELARIRQQYPRIQIIGDIDDLEDY